jgi:hypothetical protein
MLSGAGPSYKRERNSDRHRNDEFDNGRHLGHREILALTYPKRKMPPSVESGKRAAGPFGGGQAASLIAAVRLEWRGR